MKRLFLYILLLFPTIVFCQQKDGIILFEKPDESYSGDYEYAKVDSRATKWINSTCEVHRTCNLQTTLIKKIPHLNKMGIFYLLNPRDCFCCAGRIIMQAITKHLYL